MSRNIVVVGTQWGDEGKGKIVDLLTNQADAVVRFQGGHNAGTPWSLVEKKPFFTSFRLAYFGQASSV